MSKVKGPVFTPRRIISLLKDTRSSLQESQKVFGSRFSVTGTAVSLWESGKREIPNIVVECCWRMSEYEPPRMIICKYCNGRGRTIEEPKE